MKHFILGFLDAVLEHEIAFKDGYIHFWCDEKYTDPKNETEVQPYISSMLDNFCKVCGINLSRESREANGSVDILFSFTNKNDELLKVCMEIKKAHRQHVETAIRRNYLYI